MKQKDQTDPKAILYRALRTDIAYRKILIANHPLYYVDVSFCVFKVLLEKMVRWDQWVLKDLKDRRAIQDFRDQQDLLGNQGYRGFQGYKVLQERMGQMASIPQ